jgi:biopolymer transport protein TolR
MAFSSGSSSTSAEINVTPLIDVLLVLLIIFMVIVPVIPRGLQSSVPQGHTADAKLPSPLVVRVIAGTSAKGPTYRIGQQEVDRTGLRQTLQKLFATQPDHTLFVEADRALSFQQVATVVAEARVAGAGQIALGPLTKP